MAIHFFSLGLTAVASYPHLRPGPPWIAGFPEYATARRELFLGYSENAVHLAAMWVHRPAEQKTALPVVAYLCLMWTLTMV